MAPIDELVDRLRRKIDENNRMYAGKQISDHDLLIAKNIAFTMCGGDVTKNSMVNEDWVLKIEKEKFIELATSDKTADRIQYMLEKGKPLRN